MAEVEGSKDLISVLWSGADILRSKMDANEYKYIVVTSQRSGQPGVNAQEYSEFEIRVPERKNRQKSEFIFGILITSSLFTSISVMNYKN